MANNLPTSPRLKNLNGVLVFGSTPENHCLCAKYQESFAYVTVKERHPVILTNIIDHLSREKNEICQEYGEDCLNDIKTITSRLSKLKNELQTDKPFTELESTRQDIVIWNDYFKEQSKENQPSWFTACWMYEECYLYRRFYEAFELSDFLQSYDPFAKQKKQALSKSMNSIITISEYLVGQLHQLSSSGVKKEFQLLLKTCLWGNRCDLSLNTMLDHPVEKPLESVDEFEEFILVDDTLAVWKYLSDNKNCIIDYVCDNAGYELFSDLCFADLLVEAGLASLVRFHLKAIPWFVSDTMAADFDYTINTLYKSKDISPKLSELVAKWKAYLTSGKWSINDEDFWTLPFNFSEMSKVDKLLFHTLQDSKLIILKGDLNYRKLLGDINWSHTEKFVNVLRNFSPSSILALRTVKSDIICGLSPGVSENLKSKSKDWMVTGDYGVIQFSRNPPQKKPFHHKSDKKVK